MENKFTPISMKCNQEQFKAIKPILEKHGMKISEIDSFVYYSYLTNNLGGKERLIANIAEDYKNKSNRTVYEEWNQDTFLKACGIEVKNNFTPIAMKCNQEQFDAIRPILEEHGMEIVSITSFYGYPYLTNSLSNRQGLISNVSSSHKHRYPRFCHEQWDQDTFLKACGIEVENNFAPIAMKCNQQQFDAIKPILEKHGMKITEISPFDEYPYLTNNLKNQQGLISNIAEGWNAHYEQWNQDTFLKACGIETNQNTKMKTYNIKISDLKKIHDVACGKWKSKIKALITDPFADYIELTQTQVDEMFKAALNGQRPVLVEVFGEPAPKHDFKEGELIWVWDNGQQYPSARKFIKMGDSRFICVGSHRGACHWENAAPFNNGILPDNFKHLLENQ